MTTCAPPPGATVAVIGAGATGSFFSHFVANVTRGLGVSIDVYEASDRIGGRAASSNDGGDVVELGASMIIKQNRYFAEASNGLTLEQPRPSADGVSLLAVLGEGRRFEFEEDEKSTLKTLWRMHRTYGLLNLAALRRHGSDFIGNFTRLYEAQDAGKAYETPLALLETAALDRWPLMSCSDALSRSLPRWMRTSRHGETSLLAPNIARGLIAGLMRNNYGHDAWAQSGALCCFTAVAPLAAGGSTAARRVAEGNARVMEQLLERSGANVHLSHRVTSIGIAVSGQEVSPPGTPPTSPSYEVKASRADGTSMTRHYSHVVLALPNPPASLLSMNSHTSAGRRAPVALAYQHVHTTLLWGVLDPTYFGQPMRALAKVNSIADVLVGDDAAAEVPFFSLGRVGYRALSETSEARAKGVAAACQRAMGDEKDGKTALTEVPRWKLFSQNAMSESDLRALFLYMDESAIVRHAWDAPGAYPRSRPVTMDELNASFILHDMGSANGGGMVVHASAVEMATSAMEVMAVAARNAALLVARRVHAQGPPQGYEIATGEECSQQRQAAQPKS